MGGLVNRENMETSFKNTAGIATLVLKEFQFTPSSFNGFPHQNGIENLGVLIHKNFFCPSTCDLKFYIISHSYNFY